MMYSMYNAVIYDGEDAYVIKVVLKTDEILAIEDLKKYLSDMRFDCEVIKIFKLYYMDLGNLISLTDNDENRIILERFEKMYF